MTEGRRRWKKWVRRVEVGLGGSVLAFVVIAYGTQARWLPRAIVSAANGARAAVADDRVVPGVTRQLRVEVGPPAASLSLWLVEPTAAARGTVLVLHGMHGHKRYMLGVGKRLAGEGYRAVLVDLRGHGESSGRWLTYGVTEARDLSQVLDVLEQQQLLAGPVGVYGLSYGAATALMLAGRDPRVQAVVSVAAFATMRKEVPYFIRHSSRAPAWLVTDNAIARAIDEAGQLAGFDPSEASPLAAIQRSHAQVLLLHGDPDEKVPVEHSRQLHAAAPLHSELIVTATSKGHDAYCSDHDGAIARATTAWFAKWLATPSEQRSER